MRWAPAALQGCDGVGHRRLRGAGEGRDHLPGSVLRKPAGEGGDGENGVQPGCAQVQEREPDIEVGPQRSHPVHQRRDRGG